MALVLRKAFMQKNASILKCIKGRPLATAPNKKHTASLLHKQMKRNLGKRVQRFTLVTCSELNNQQNGRVSLIHLPHKNASSPCLPLSTKTNGLCLPRSNSAVFHTDKHSYHSKVPHQIVVEKRTFATVSRSAKDAPLGMMQGLESVCACPCPCPGNCCLPPPCNTPPKCLQYMTGYYYYPYGTWFCGPYHVATGPCGPCTGPVVPGGPCGPCGPCPGGPCGPPGLGCSCGPLPCCGVCGAPNTPSPPPNFPPGMPPNAHQNPQFAPFTMQGMHPDAYGYNNNCVQYSYDPIPSFSPYPPDSMPWAQQMPGPNMPSPTMPSHTGPFFGPGINVPISPVPVTTEPCGPIIPQPNPNIPSSPKPKSSVRLNRDYMKETRSVASPYGAKPPMPTRPPMPTSPSAVYLKKPGTGTRPISTTRNPCSSNLTPKPLRQGPPSRYDAICALSRHNPYTKPRINSRTLPQLDTIQVCYYTTRSMKRYAHTDTRLASTEKQWKITKKHKDNASSLEHKADSKPLCYWCLISDKSTCPCQHCGNSTAAHNRMPVSHIRSKKTQIMKQVCQNEKHLKSKTFQNYNVL